MIDRNKFRKGYSLIEMMVVMSALSLLLVVNTKWIHESIKFASKTNQRQRQHLLLKRLNSQLREDVRQCRNMKIADQRLSLLYDDNRTCTYTIVDNEIIVVEEMDAEVISQDRYRMERSTIVEWEASEMPDWITLIVTRQVPSLGKSSQQTSDTGPLSPTESTYSIPKAHSKRGIEYHITTGPNPWN